jgi:transcriptional regulator with GAF, ATPase, and Fis domain
MVKVNCAALPAQLLESELFGHARGAFTGAHRDREGRFELACGGTIFLDEIGEMDVELQVKLLRVLQEGEFQRVGENRTRTSDARLIAATNADLETAMGEGRFREDLYYRLNVFSIEIPPLRLRLADIPLLADHFREKYTHTYGKAVEAIDGSALDLLMRHRWPGNVRELENVIQRAVVLAGSGRILPEHLPDSIRREGIVSEPTEAEKAGNGGLDRTALERALEQTGWNVAQAARLLGVSRNTLYTHIHRHNLRRPR